jgi:hypothetical protein
MSPVDRKQPGMHEPKIKVETVQDLKMLLEMAYKAAERIEVLEGRVPPDSNEGVTDLELIEENRDVGGLLQSFKPKVVEGAQADVS